jgi:hypothetical protein
MTATQPHAKTIRWRVPGLIERPVVGTSCCASTAEAIVAQELSMLPGIEGIAVDCAAGTVDLAYRPALVCETEIASALAEVGYPPDLARETLEGGP